MNERQHKIEDARDFIRTETQRNLRMYKRRIQKAAEERLKATQDVVDEDGRLPDPMDAARAALEAAERKLLSA